MEHAAHQEMMAGEGADQRIVARFRRGGELDDLFLAVIEELAGPDDFLVVRDEADGEVVERFGWARLEDE